MRDMPTVRPISVKIKQALEKGGAADAKTVLGDLLQNLRDIEKQAAARVVALFVIAIAAELAAQSTIGSISVWGVSVADPAVVTRLGILATAYMYFSIVALFAARRLTERAIEAIFSEVYPSLYQGGLSNFFIPLGAFRIFNLIHNHISGIRRKLVKLCAQISLIIIFISPPLYLTWAIFRCFSIFGIVDVFTWCVAIVAACFSIAAFLIMLSVVDADIGDPAELEETTRERLE